MYNCIYYTSLCEVKLKSEKMKISNNNRNMGKSVAFLNFVVHAVKIAVAAQLMM